MQSDDPAYDLAIVGGGIDGCGIARDAAGRGFRAFLCERADLATGTSSASDQPIHGGLRYLEHREFRLAREALIEREVLWAIAPHIVWKLRFVLPHRPGLRPGWLLRLGLFLYDRLGGRKRLLPTRTLQLRKHAAGDVLKPEFSLGFEYSDCWVDDSRLVVLNACDAADRGATIATRTACISAERHGRFWHLVLRDEASGAQHAIRARALVNATGPWVADVAGTTIGAHAQARVRLVQGSHIVVPRLYDRDECYIFRNAGGGICFLIPYERDFTLIGTTETDFHGDPTGIAASAEAIADLCQSASACLKQPVTPDMVVWTYSGIRPLFDDGSGAARDATRDYVVRLEAPAGGAPLLSLFGGKIATYRRLAESALALLAPHLPPAAGEKAGWTGQQPLPGGDFAVDGFAALLAETSARFPFLPAPTVRRLLRAYGTKIDDVLVGATSLEGLGRDFGAGLTEAELRYLVRAEWARTAEDVVWRRSKLGLRLSAEQVAAIDAALREIVRGSGEGA